MFQWRNGVRLDSIRICLLRKLIRYTILMEINILFIDGDNITLVITK